MTLFLYLILKRDSWKGIRAFITIHHPPRPSLLFFTFHSCLSRKATQFVPIGTNQLHLSSERISSKSCYIPKQINSFSVYDKRRIFTPLWAMVSMPDFLSNVLANPWNTWLFQWKIRKLLQGSTPHALNITGHSSSNPRLKHKQNLLSIYLTRTLFSSASHEILCEQTYS